MQKLIRFKPDENGWLLLAGIHQGGGTGGVVVAYGRARGTAGDVFAVSYYANVERYGGYDHYEARNYMLNESEKDDLYESVFSDGYSYGDLGAALRANRWFLKHVPARKSIRDVIEGALEYWKPKWVL